MYHLIKSPRFYPHCQACIGVFAVGLNDTATGANLPSIQERYNLPYAVVSLVFLAGSGGYVLGPLSQSIN